MARISKAAKPKKARHIDELFPGPLQKITWLVAKTPGRIRRRNAIKIHYQNQVFMEEFRRLGELYALFQQDSACTPTLKGIDYDVAQTSPETASNGANTDICLDFHSCKSSLPFPQIEDCNGDPVRPGVRRKIRKVSRRVSHVDCPQALPEPSPSSDLPAESIAVCSRPPCDSENSPVDVVPFSPESLETFVDITHPGAGKSYFYQLGPFAHVASLLDASPSHDLEIPQSSIQKAAKRIEDVALLPHCE